jgi:hypothetical protein
MLSASSGNSPSPSSLTANSSSASRWASASICAGAIGWVLARKASASVSLTVLM